MKKILQERWQSFKYAFRGIGLLFKTEIHGKFHVFFALFVILAGFFFSINTVEWCFVIVTISVVIGAEAFNSAIERLTDLASPDYHPLARDTKDLAAGAVLIIAIGAVIIGFIIFLPKVLHWIGIINIYQ